MSDINPKTKVGELLDNYPELEAVLLEISSAFSTLKNPVMRKTVAKVASLQQAAVIGGVKVEDLVNKLREAVGLQPMFGEAVSSEYLLAEKPDWLVMDKVVRRYDAREIIKLGGSPMKTILDETANLNEGDIYELVTPFIPAPVLDILKSKSFSIYTKAENDYFVSYILKHAL